MGQDTMLPASQDRQRDEAAGHSVGDGDDRETADDTDNRDDGGHLRSLEYKRRLGDVLLDQLHQEKGSNEEFEGQISRWLNPMAYEDPGKSETLIKGTSLRLRFDQVCDAVKAIILPFESGSFGGFIANDPGSGKTIVYFGILAIQRQIHKSLENFAETDHGALTTRAAKLTSRNEILNLPARGRDKKPCPQSAEMGFACPCTGDPITKRLIKACDPLGPAFLITSPNLVPQSYREATRYFLPCAKSDDGAVVACESTNVEDERLPKHVLERYSADIRFLSPLPDKPSLSSYKPTTPGDAKQSMKQRANAAAELAIERAMVRQELTNKPQKHLLLIIIAWDDFKKLVARWKKPTPVTWARQTQPDFIRLPALLPSRCAFDEWHLFAKSDQAAIQYFWKQARGSLSPLDRTRLSFISGTPFSGEGLYHDLEVPLSLMRDSGEWMDKQHPLHALSDGELRKREFDDQQSFDDLQGGADPDEYVQARPWAAALRLALSRIMLCRGNGLSAESLSQVTIDCTIPEDSPLEELQMLSSELKAAATATGSAEHYVRQALRSGAGLPLRVATSFPRIAGHISRGETDVTSEGLLQDLLDHGGEVWKTGLWPLMPLLDDSPLAQYLYNDVCQSQLYDKQPDVHGKVARKGHLIMSSTADFAVIVNALLAYWVTKKAKMEDVCHIFVHPKMPVDEREDLIRKFNLGTTSTILVTTSEVLGVGRNLQGACYLSIPDLPPDAISYTQAVNRLWRRRQQFKVFVKVYRKPGCPADRILETVGPMSGGGDGWNVWSWNVLLGDCAGLDTCEPTGGKS